VTRISETEVIAEIAILRYSIEELSCNFYHQHSQQVDVRRTVGRTVIRDIVENNKDVPTVARDLQNYLRDIPAEPDDPKWIDHLDKICQTATHVRQKISNRADTWSFGSWGDAMLFPEVIRNGREIIAPQYKQQN